MVTKVVGGIAVVHGADDFMTGARQLISGQAQRSATEAVVTEAADVAMERRHAEALGRGTDMALGFVSPIGGGPTLLRGTVPALVSVEASGVRIPMVVSTVREVTVGAETVRTIQQTSAMAHAAMMSGGEGGGGEGTGAPDGGGASGSTGGSSPSHAGGATRPRSELLASDRRAAREHAITGLRERLTSGNLAERDIHTLERLQQQHGQEAVQAFEETGRLPRDFEFSHLYSASEYPELARRSDLGVLTDRAEHIHGHHGGDTAVPLHGQPRNASWEESWGTQVVGDSPEELSYLGMTCY